MPIRRICLALFAALLVAAPGASAGTPGKWTQLGEANLSNIDEAALARTADGTLHAVWTIPGSNNDTLVHDAIGPNGVVAPPNAIQTGWATISNVPDLVTTADGLRVFFGGLRTTDPNDTNLNMNTATAPPSGATWDLAPGTVVTGDSAYASDSGAAVQADGTPLLSWGGTGSGVFTHRGLDPATPNFPIHSQLGGCCGYSPDIAVDTKSGAAFIVWYSNATDKLGVWAQSLDPGTGGPSGAPANMPGSTTLFNGKPDSSQMLQRTPIAARAGGGVYVAYPGGYPTTTQVRFWRIADSKSAVVGTSDRNHIASLAAAPDGRMWVFWSEQTSPPQVFARRSNKAATKFGPAIKIKAPAAQQSAYRITGNARAGPLDLVVLFGGVSSQALFHTQVLPGLDIAGSPKKKGGPVKLTVTDPEPVAGVKVSLGGKSGTTDKNGHVTLKLKATKAKSLEATAKKAGYTTATEKLKTK